MVGRPAMTGGPPVPSANRRRLRVEQLGGTAVTAARALLGAILVRRHADELHRAVIVETEAYRHDDPASHSFTGLTPRNASMFGPPGRAYVYRSYGVHWCMNVVAEPEGTGAGVLLRAARLLSDPTVVRQRRATRVADEHLLRGPGCLTRGLAIDRPSHDGAKLCLDTDEASDVRAPRKTAGSRVGDLWIEVDDRWPINDALISTGPRVGVSRAAEVPWRWWIRGEPAVSVYRRSPRA